MEDDVLERVKRAFEAARRTALPDGRAISRARGPPGHSHRFADTLSERERERKCWEGNSHFE